MLRNELVLYAALDAYASAKVSKAVMDLLKVHRKPRKEDLAPSVPVRLLPKRGNEPVAYAIVESAEEKTELIRNATSNKLREREYFDVHVKLVSITHPATLLPPPHTELSTEGQALRDFTPGDIISWSRKCLQLSTNAELHQMRAAQ